MSCERWSIRGLVRSSTMVTTDLEQLGGRVKVASLDVRRATGALRQEALRSSARHLRAKSTEILNANQADLDQAITDGLSATAQDRLRLDEGRVAAMADGLDAVALLPDPVGQVVGGSVRPNGLAVSQVRSPLGVIGVIYENRPNVTSDAAGLCLAAGNAAFLRGSASALRSNIEIVAALRCGVEEAGLPADSVALVEDTSHETAARFMQLEGVIDMLIPRGGPSLIASMRANATVPFVLDGDGNCHVYVHRDADLEMAISIIKNAKTQRPGVCNAMESLVLHVDIAAEVLRRLAREIPEIQLLGDERACGLSASIAPASPEDFATEFLDLIASVCVVDDLSSALAHIQRYSSGHTEAIITTSLATADRFVAEIDAAAVVVNASTRFVDGAELGLGAEVGISTQKIHARGPMGLEALTSTRWVIRGEGQVRT